jgi:cell division cycle protein 20 (cofactor of APC complex)
MTRSAVDYEDLIDTSFSDANQAVRTTLRPRWERKKQQQVQADVSMRDAAGGDRFIPNRAGMNMEISKHLMRSASFGKEEENEVPADMKAIADAKKSSYNTTLSSKLLGVEDISDNRVISYQEKAPAPKGDTVNNLNILYSASASSKTKKSNTKLVSRHIPTAPSRILDAPDLMDDYYLNLVSWSDTNILAVALSQTVYLWNAGSGDIQELCTFDQGPNAHISSVKWVQEGGAHLAVGLSSGMTQLWDVHQGKQLRGMDGHTDRVGSLAWNRHVLSSGSRDTKIVNHDVRVARHQVAMLESHTQEVCGLAWSPDGETLASGGNDNLLCLWDASRSTPRYKFTDHQAAVKAVAWSPHERNLLATGGGTADRTIKFWNSGTGKLLNSIDTGSQVCALQWNPYEKEILSSHGFARNQLCLWKYPSMAKIKEFEGHTSRVLQLAVSPDGGTVLSAAADETLRFWDIFAPPAAKKRSGGDPFTAASATGKTRWTTQLR